MMKKVSIFAVLASLSLSMTAQLFWKVTGNGLERESYILGTMHDAPVSMIDEIPGLNDAIQNSEPGTEMAQIMKIATRQHIGQTAVTRRLPYC